MAKSATPVPERRIDRFRPKLLIFGLIIFLIAVWGSAYNLFEREKSRAIEAATARAQNHAVFFAQNVSSTLNYADDYAKALRRIYLKTHDLSAVREYIKDIPPNLTILSHVTIMDSNGVPILITDGRKERKSKPGKNARDRGYFKFQNSTNKIRLLSRKHLKVAIRA